MSADDVRFFLFCPKYNLIYFSKKVKINGKKLILMARRHFFEFFRGIK